MYKNVIYFKNIYDYKACSLYQMTAVYLDHINPVKLLFYVLGIQIQLMY